MAVTRPFFLRDILRNYPGSGIIASPASVAPTEPRFLFVNEPGLVWRLNAVSTFIVLDVAYVATTQALALLWTNLRATDQLRWRAANTEGELTTTPIYDSGLINAYSGDLLTAKPTKHLHILPSNVSARYWRLDIDATGHPDGYIQLGRMLLGIAITLQDDMDTELSQFIVDPSVVDEGPGYEDVEEYLPLPGWQCTFSWVSDVFWRSFFAFSQEVGSRRPVLFVPLPLEPDRLQDSAVFGRMQTIEGRHPIHDGWQVEIRIVSLHP